MLVSIATHVYFFLAILYAGGGKLILVRGEGLVGVIKLFDSVGSTPFCGILSHAPADGESVSPGPMQASK